MGRFASPDTIVPDPGNPQSFNRYSYVNNDPVNYTDPTGHCLNSYDAGSADLETCLSALASVGNYLAEAAYYSGRSFPSDLYMDWLESADIAMLENLMSSYGIGYGYTFTRPRPATPSGPPGQSTSRDACQYWQDCYDPVSEYVALTASVWIVNGKVTLDDWGNVYISAGLASPGFGAAVVVGNVRGAGSEHWKNVEDLAVDQRQGAVEDFLIGRSSGACVAYGAAACVAGNPAGQYAVEAGIGFGLISTDVSYSWLIYDANQR